MEELRTCAGSIAKRAAVPPELVIALVGLLAEWFFRCLSDPEKAAAWLRQDTLSTRWVIGRKVKAEWRRLGGDPARLSAVRLAVLDHCRAATAPQVAAIYSARGLTRG